MNLLNKLKELEEIMMLYPNGTLTGSSLKALIECARVLHISVTEDIGENFDKTAWDALSALSQALGVEGGKG